MRLPSTRSETTSNPSFFFITLEITARTECGCQPVCLQSSSRLTPLIRHSSTVIDAILVLFLASDCAVAPCFAALLCLEPRASARFNFTANFFGSRAAAAFFDLATSCSFPTRRHHRRHDREPRCALHALFGEHRGTLRSRLSAFVKAACRPPCCAGYSALAV